MKEAFTAHCYTCGSGLGLGEKEAQEFYEQHKARGCIVEKKTYTVREGFSSLGMKKV